MPRVHNLLTFKQQASLSSAFNLPPAALVAGSSELHIELYKGFSVSLHLCLIQYVQIFESTNYFPASAPTLPLHPTHKFSRYIEGGTAVVRTAVACVFLIRKEKLRA